MRVSKISSFCFGLTLLALAGTVALAQEQSSEKTEASKKRPSYLAIERAARSKFPDAYKFLKRERYYTKRLPAHWGELGLSDAQTKKIYAIQRDYFEEIADLEARIARLERERDERMRAALTDRQRDALDEKIDKSEKARKSGVKTSRDRRM